MNSMKSLYKKAGGIILRFCHSANVLESLIHSDAQKAIKRLVDDAYEELMTQSCITIGEARPFVKYQE
jgi:hypothetical protein